MPTVTVLMPVYNGEKYLKESIESILAQTFTDFEFLIIDDGSTDNSVLIINSYDDARIRFIKNEANLGIVCTLNKGLDLASGKYTARMDCDDISLPTRLEKQVMFMENNPDIGISGTWAQTFGELSNNDVWKYPCNPEDISCLLIFHSVLVHPSVIMRKSFLRQYNLKYNTECIYAEDYNLWVNASSFFKLANISEVLLKYRLTENSTGLRNREKQLEAAKKARIFCLEKYRIKLTKKQIDLFSRISSYEKLEETRLFYDAMDILNSIYNQITSNKVFDNRTISKPIYDYINFLVDNIFHVDLTIIRKYISSRIFFYNILNKKNFIILKSLVKKYLLLFK